MMRPNTPGLGSVDDTWNSIAMAILVVMVGAQLWIEWRRYVTHS